MMQEEFQLPSNQDAACVIEKQTMLGKSLLEAKSNAGSMDRRSKKRSASMPMQKVY